MNKSLTALYMLCAISSQAWSQSLVTMIAGDIYFTEYSQAAAGTSKVSVQRSEDWPDGINSKFQLDTSSNVNDGTTDQNGLLYGHQTQFGLSGNWGTLTMGRQSNAFFYDSYSLDPRSHYTNRSTSDALMGLSIPATHQNLIASYVGQNERTDNVTTVAVKQYSLSYTYPLSRATNLFIARTRADNPVNTQGSFGSNTGLGAKTVQFGVRHAF